MTASSPNMIYLKDYQPPHYLVNEVHLHFDLHEEKTQVRALVSYCRNKQLEDIQEAPLVLNGEAMQLTLLLLDGRALVEGTDYELNESSVTIYSVPETFALESVVEIKPQENTRLSGLYKSSGNFCTQCESHGFRRITYFPDRPDILTQFTVCISADKKLYPLLLSNGNKIEERDLLNGRHWVKWEDPSLKPSYLFALVAGDFDVINDNFTTRSGRNVSLHVYVEKGKGDQAEHAMHSLKRAMKWDEDTFGREYDLNQYMIVAVSDFNFGAMENKGLNIFNDRYILAKPDTATDDNYVDIEEVIGHEYFHNWSGNRVTLRDWFQITLKEGLTVFRDQSFTEDVTLKAVKRIRDARVIRNVQFAQDAGPMAHPIRPDHYIEINNFYTVTVYNKGAEVIRMIKTLLGPEAFRKAMDQYFFTYDGQAVTSEDFVRTMQKSSGVDLSQFMRWYSQAGTPVLTITDNYDAENKRYTLKVNQSCPPTPEQPQKDNFHIPLAVGLINADGSPCELEVAGEGKVRVQGNTAVLDVKNSEDIFHFDNVNKKPVPSLLRHFSAPVKVNYAYTDDELAFLMMHDHDDFARWEASQMLATQVMLKLVDDHKESKSLKLPTLFVDAFNKVLTHEFLSEIFVSEILILPTVSYLLEIIPCSDIDVIHEVREFTKTELAKQLKKSFLSQYHAHVTESSAAFDPEVISKRHLKNTCLAYLMHLSNSDMMALCMEQFNQSSNMTDTMGALLALNNVAGDEREHALATFYDKWREEHLVVDKWFGLQAQSFIPGTLSVVQSLLDHPAYDEKNPNKVRALVGAFCSHNHVNFHAKDGAGYVFLHDQVKKADQFNPQLAARLIEPFTHWRRYDDARQALMRDQLEALAKSKLSNDLYEIVTKTLL